MGRLRSVEVYPNPIVSTSNVLTPSVSGEIHLFPNPSKGFFTLEVPTSAAFYLEILDVQGHRKLLFTDLTGPQVMVSINDLPGGIYFARTWNDQWSSTARFVKID